MQVFASTFPQKRRHCRTHQIYFIWKFGMNPNVNFSQQEGAFCYAVSSGSRTSIGSSGPPSSSGQDRSFSEQERVTTETDRGYSESSEEEEERKELPRRRASETIRIPCKARGIVDAHNPRTAYMDVPPDAIHGLILVCSHPTCAQSGRRFRYCAVCEIPVAKRNFNKRHWKF